MQTNRACAGTATLRQSGIGLIEIMISLVVGIFLVAGALAVFANGRGIFETNDRVGLILENARFTFDLLDPDLRSSGNWGLFYNASSIAGRATPADPLTIAVNDDCDVNWAIHLDRPIEGSDNFNPFTATCLSGADDYLPGTDFVVTRHASAAPLDDADLEAGRIYLRVDASHGQLFVGTAIPAGFAPDAQNFALLTRAYFIAARSVSGDDMPSLQRLSLDVVGGQPSVVVEEIVPGVEDLQVQFGVDTDGDGSVNQYVDPSPLIDIDAILAVRVWLLMRAERFEPGYTDESWYFYADTDYRPSATPDPDDDAFRRRLITKTIAVRNRIAANGN